MAPQEGAMAADRHRRGAERFGTADCRDLTSPFEEAYQWI